MLQVGKAFYELRDKLLTLYDEREAAAIAHEVLSHITGLSKTERLMQKEQLFTATQQSQYETATSDLQRGRPLQYILGTSWFMNRQFVVNEAVLIPRPETEELVQWIIDDHKHDSKISILDIGTGSGCIPISLQLILPNAGVSSCDISQDALKVATTNAQNLGAQIQLLQLDFLDTTKHTKLGMFDVIVSNPPYIPMAEQASIHINVKDHEPSIALFVPDDDALLFYKAIALFGKTHLNQGGCIYCELDADHALQTKILFEEHGYPRVEIKKDMHGNWRMLKTCN